MTDDWVIVPRVPTKEMIDAAWASALAEDALGVWNEMIEAAPKRLSESQQVWKDSAERIDDYNRREAAGEDVSREIRPRMPGGSDW
jgi:hypothetical protein